MEDNSILNDLVRVGIVTDRDEDNCRCRVKYPDAGITSGWLFVLQRQKGKVDVKPDNEHTHYVHDTYTGGGSASVVPAHDHPGTVTAAWVPKVNETVLVLYVPTENGDGFVLGGIV